MPSYGYSVNSLSARRRHGMPMQRIIIVVLVLCILAVLGWLGVRWLMKKPFDASLQATTLPAAEEWLPFGQGMLSLSGQTLTFLDEQGTTKWSPTLPMSGHLAVSDLTSDTPLIGIYNDLAFALVDNTGTLLYRQDFPQGILRMRVGSQMTALQSQDEEGPLLQIYNRDAMAVETLRFSDRAILDYGFYQDNQLWVLLLDNNANLPGCRINTYNPGVSLTGMITVPEQLIYRVLVTPLKEVVAIGTESVICYNAIGTRKEEVSITGWTLQDAWVDGSDIHLVLSQSMDNATTLPVPTSMQVTPPPTPIPSALPTGSPSSTYQPTATPATMLPATVPPTSTVNAMRTPFSLVRTMKLASRTAKNNNAETYFDVTNTVIALPVSTQQVVSGMNGQRLYLLAEGGIKVLRNGVLEQELPLSEGQYLRITADRRLLYVPNASGIARMALPK